MIGNRHIQAVLPEDRRTTLIKLRKFVKENVKRLRATCAKQEKELDESSKWLLFKEIGDSLLAGASNMRKGLSEYELENIHTHSMEKISLNPKLDAVRNAGLYYKRSKKAKRSREICLRKVQETRAAILAQEADIAELDRCLSLDAGSDEFNTCAELILSRQAAGQSKAALQKKTSGQDGKPDVPFRHYTIGDWNIYIGKNTTQNDEISVHFAKPWDIWLHVAAHAGSHVIIRRDKNSPWPPQPVCHKAAALAVWFSKAKHTSYAEVHITEARYVHKRRHAPPGEVVLDQYKTVRVAPSSPQQLFGAERSGN